MKLSTFLKTLFTVFATANSAISMSQTTTPAIAPCPEIETQVEQILGSMTLEEKIGQMCELTIDVITDGSHKENFVLNEEALARAFKIYKVGSILNVPHGVSQQHAHYERWLELFVARRQS